MSTKDWIEKDYYKVLGVSKDAKPEEIKKAYRKLARDNHPDQNPGNAAAEQRFKEISEANDVLSNPDKRKEYDSGGAFGFGGGQGPFGPGRGAPQGGGFGAGDFGDIFSSIFNRGGGRPQTQG